MKSPSLGFCFNASLVNITNIKLNNAITIEISHYCLVLRHYRVCLTVVFSRFHSFLICTLQFSAHHGKFVENEMAADKVSLHPYALLLSSGTVYTLTCYLVFELM